MSLDFSQVATKADLKEYEAKLKRWMVVFALWITASNFGMDLALYFALKPAPAVRPAQAQLIEPLARQASAALR